VSPCEWPHKIKALRFVSSKFRMSTRHLNMFVDSVDDEYRGVTFHKVEMLVAMYACASNPEEIPSVDCIYGDTSGSFLHGFNKQELELIRARVGLAAFDPQTFHLHSPSFSMQLNRRDDWMLTKLVLSIADKEEGGLSGNLSDIMYIPEDEEQPAEMQIQSAWTTAPPKTGSLRFRYSGKSRDTKLREELAYKALGWSPHVHMRDRRRAVS